MIHKLVEKNFDLLAKHVSGHVLLRLNLILLDIYQSALLGSFSDRLIGLGSFGAKLTFASLVAVS